MAKKKKDVVAVPLASRPLDGNCFYHSEQGSIACPDHRPVEGGDTWKLDRWRKMTAEEIEAFERDLGRKIACETCAAVKRNEARDATPPVEQIAESPVVEQKKKGRKAKAEVALATFCEHFLTHLAESGKSAGTCFSYRLELKSAIDALGAETKLGDLTPAQVLAYFGSARVNKKRNGKAKSPLSILKTQRVLRLALVWAVEKKVLATAPLPEKLATH